MKSPYPGYGKPKPISADCLSLCTAAFRMVWECSHHAEGTRLGDPGFGTAEKLSGMRTALPEMPQETFMQIKGGCNL